MYYPRRNFITGSHTDLSWDLEGRQSDEARHSINIVHAVRYLIARFLNANSDNEDATRFFKDPGGLYGGDNCGCGIDQTSLEVLGINNQQYTREIPDCEKCMMKRLYCASPSSVNSSASTILDHTISVFPNPSLHQLQIAVTGLPVEREWAVKVFNISGEVVANRVVSVAEHQQSIITMTAQGMPTGTYYIIVSSAGVSMVSQPVVIQR